MSFIPEDIAKQILEQADLLDIAKQLIPALKKKGASQIGVCPFCNGEKFTVTPSKSIWKCFSCNEGGKDVVSLVMAIGKRSYPDALRFIAGLLKI
ncbi:MAG: CHC2 zinc finger domain-containing protein, partial [Saprospiraceae bacterium]